MRKAVVNRILDAIEAMKPRIEKLDRAQREKLDVALLISHDEWFAWQEKRAHAQAGGRINLEESLTLYEMIGNRPTVFNGQPLQVKVIITKVMSELLVPAAGNP